MKKRKIDIAVISDVHLGTYGCHADELLAYLSSIEPDKLILNGDIIDVWQFSKPDFPAAHLRVIKKIISMASKGTAVYYLTGNHDDVLRKFAGTRAGNFSIRNKLVLQLDGRKAWFFHGDVFDLSVRIARVLARLGSFGFELLILINRFVNWCLTKMGKEKYSIAERVKNGGKNVVKYISDFEKTASDLAVENGYDYVVCGHIHRPKKEIYENNYGKTIYLNSGDWVENLTALEYSFKRWKVYHFSYTKLSAFFADDKRMIRNRDQFISTARKHKAKNPVAKEKKGESVKE